MQQRHFDKTLLFAMFGLAAFGLILVASSSYAVAAENLGDRYFFVRQHLIYLAVATVAFLISQRIKLEGWRKLAFPIYIVSTLLLVLLLVSPLASYAGGAYRWIKLGGLRFQPSEVARLGMIIFLAHVITNKGARITHFRQGLLLPLILLMLVAALIMAEPDFGSAVSITLTGLTLLYIGGARLKHLLFCGLLGLPAVAYLLLGSHYRLQRLLAFLDPWRDPMDQGFQIIQSFVAIRSGGLFGQGIGDGIQKFFYLPEAHNDFAFAILGEEMGFIGILMVVGLFVVLVVRGMSIAAKCHERFYALLAAGITFSIGMQAFTNMAVVMGLLPTKGLVLPLISFGGSSLLVTFVSLGILNRIAIKVEEAT